MFGSISPLAAAVLRFSVVRMLTTEGPTRSTSSVKSGRPTTTGAWGWAWTARGTTSTAVSARVATAHTRRAARGTE